MIVQHGFFVSNAGKQNNIQNIAYHLSIYNANKENVVVLSTLFYFDLCCFLLTCSLSMRDGEYRSGRRWRLYRSIRYVINWTESCNSQSDTIDEFVCIITSFKFIFEYYFFCWSIHELSICHFLSFSLQLSRFPYSLHYHALPTSFVTRSPIYI